MYSAFGVDHTISKNDTKTLVRRYGLTGPPPKELSREERRRVWEARDEHLNRKKRKYDRQSKVAGGVENSAKVVGGAMGAALIGGQLRDAWVNSHRANKKSLDRFAAQADKYHPMAGKVVRFKPGFKTLAGAVGAGAVASTAGFARRRAHKKSEKYASARGGIASGVSRRMRNYDIGKAEQTPSESLRHKKRVQAGIAYGTSTLGLAALGTKATAGALPKAAPKLTKLPGAPKSLGSKTGAKSMARKIDQASSALVATGAGLGGVGGFNFAAIQRQEGKPR